MTKQDERLVRHWVAIKAIRARIADLERDITDLYLKQERGPR